ncbi:energy transducer TonB [Psychrosphaera haliotis]|uniref:energy transducer TonB n=1 Tax=Psychrosphaera haliotis TaxID=555083 RepID=UPI0012DA12C2
MHVHASSKLDIPDSDIKTARLVESIVDAKPVDKKAPRYPSSAAKRGREGWVQMSFIIDTDGSVLEPTVIDSAGDVAFERAALRAIKKWKYTPAEKDGEVIQQCDTKLQFDFSINNNGVSEKFSTFYNSAAKLLENKEADKLGLN